MPNWAKGPRQLLSALWESFKHEFKPDTDDIRRCSTDVKAELIALDKAQADQDRQLRSIERGEASEGRRKLNKFFSRVDNKLDKIEAWQLQRAERGASECALGAPDEMLIPGQENEDSSSSTHCLFVITRLHSSKAVGSSITIHATLGDGI